MVRGWGCVPRGLAMAREDSVKCLRCLLYALNLLFWVSAATRAGPGREGQVPSRRRRAGTAPALRAGPGTGGTALVPLAPCQAAPAREYIFLRGEKCPWKLVGSKTELGLRVRIGVPVVCKEENIHGWLLNWVSFRASCDPR